MSQQEETKEPHGKSRSKEDRLIEQVRAELESYFAPSNIANDFNLRQKMTTDGFIDINLLLDLKLMQDLVTNRDVLLEAISRSKLLKMNTGCTMVKYMPILERNILILRDIPDKTMKEEIMTIFDNEHCSPPHEVHSDIGNHWFCQFHTEEQCLATAQYLNMHGVFKGEKLHVRVKAIHDKNKADTSPQMQNTGSSKSKSKRAAHPPPQPYGPSMPYSPGQWYAYYGTGAVTTDYGFNSGGGYPNPRDAQQSRRGRSSAKRASAADPDQSKANGAPSVTPPPSGGGAPAQPAEPMTASSDYPGQFDKYSMATFLEIYQAMEEKDDLALPQSMRGRDVRIISDDLLMPCAVAPIEDPKEFDDNAGRGRRRRKRGRGGRGKKKEMRGYYYEDEALERQSGQNFYDHDYPPPYYPEDEEAYYYRDEYGDQGDYYYDEEEESRPRGRRNGRGRARGRNDRPRGGRGRRNEQEEEEEETEQRRGNRRGPRARNARQYNSRRRPAETRDSPDTDANAKGGKKKKKSKAKPRQREVWAPKGSKSQDMAVKSGGDDGGGNGKKGAEEKWVPKGAPTAKRYTTQKGVFQAKSPASSSQ